jgi:hypothetical protein
MIVYDPSDDIIPIGGVHLTNAMVLTTTILREHVEIEDDRYRFFHVSSTQPRTNTVRLGTLNRRGSAITCRSLSPWPMSRRLMSSISRMLSPKMPGVPFFFPLPDPPPRYGDKIHPDGPQVRVATLQMPGQGRERPNPSASIQRGDDHFHRRFQEQQSVSASDVNVAGSSSD